MSDQADIDPSLPLRLEQHEEFAYAIASGKTGAQAYKDTVARDCTAKTALEAASKLLRNPNVRARVAYLRKQLAEYVSDRHGWDREKLASYLIEALETPVGEVDQQHRLAQEVAVTQDGTKVKTFGKAEAAKQLAQLCGWNEPEQVESKLEIIVRSAPANG